jgi:hypothetical protein
LQTTFVTIHMAARKSTNFVAGRDGQQPHFIYTNGEVTIFYLVYSATGTALE